MSWLVVLGAGASMAAPTQVPAFVPLRDAIFEGLGWKKNHDGAYVHPDPVGGRRLPALSSVRLLTRGVPPEVVFGTLHRFGVPFAPFVEELLTSSRPPHNAAHAVAAAALAQGGAVWTPNIDLAVEDAYAARTGQAPGPFVVGADDAAIGPEATPSFMKFHGSADRPGSLAFTDLELLPRYSARDAARFARTAAGRTVVLYGYRGADVDLRPLLDAAFASADDVVWYEPSEESRAAIARTFGAAVRFDPPAFGSGDTTFGAPLGPAQPSLADGVAVGLGRRRAVAVGLR